MHVEERGPRGLAGEVCLYSVSLQVNRQKCLDIMPMYHKNMLRHRCLDKKSRQMPPGTSSLYVVITTP